MNERTEHDGETRELRDLARRWRDRLQRPPKRIPPDVLQYACHRRLKIDPLATVEN